MCATRVSNKKNNDVREVVPTAILNNFIIFIIFRGGRRLYHPPMRAPKGKVMRYTQTGNGLLILERRLIGMD